MKEGPVGWMRPRPAFACIYQFCMLVHSTSCLSVSALDHGSTLRFAQATEICRANVPCRCSNVEALKKYAPCLCQLVMSQWDFRRPQTLDRTPKANQILLKPPCMGLKTPQRQGRTELPCRAVALPLTALLSSNQVSVHINKSVCYSSKKLILPCVLCMQCPVTHACHIL